MEGRQPRPASVIWRLGLCALLLVACILQSCVGTAYHIQDISPQSDAEATRVIITVDGPVQPEVGRLSQPDRLYLDLPDTSLRPGWGTQDITIADGRLHSIHVSRPRYNFVRVILGLDTLEQYRVLTQTKPYRIVAELVGKNGRLVPDTPQNSPASIASRAHMAQASPADALTIVLDPGHGGKDPGAIGPTGLEEKVFVLQVAKALQQVIQRELPQARVLLTRDRDVFLPLKERTRIANQHKADVFVSLHANASPHRDASGIETWYLSFAASDRAKGQAARENMMATAQLSELDIILRHLQQTDRINQSATLAHITQTTLSRHMATRYHATQDRGVEGAPFVVLLHTAMPSILVELSFISNPQEEQRMRLPEYRRTLAQGVWQGLQRFLQTSVTVATTKG